MTTYSATLLWRNNEVGRLSNITNDMWYLDGDWQSTGSQHAVRFTEIACKLDAKEVMRTFKGMVALLSYDGSTSDPQKVLVLSLDKSKILMRMILDETAAYLDLSLFEPWKRLDDPTPYEIELKKEVGFFHPLRWKMTRAIGIRTDRDDVLFEILIPEGRAKFAVVHLTYSRQRSRKFPLTTFYKDWKDFYENRLLEDQRSWKDDQ